MKSPLRDAGIPVLTEVITHPARDTAAAASWPQPAITVDSMVDPLATMQEDAGAADNTVGSALSADDFDRLVEAVRESVLLQLQSRYESVLGDRIQLRLAEKLRVVAAEVAEDIKSELLDELHDLVAVASHKNAEDMIFKKE